MSRAWRMILAHHSLDRHAQQQVTDEHDGCADCWQDTAVAAVDAAGSLLISSALPDMDTSGVVTGPTVNWLLRVIDGCLRAEERDRREVDGSDRRAPKVPGPRKTPTLAVSRGDAYAPRLRR
jgi:hypothetical protein